MPLKREYITILVARWLSQDGLDLGNIARAKGLAQLLRVTAGRI